MTSMKDISKVCGVSVATVSKALNDHRDIGEETKRKIRRVAREMGYSPNSAARALKTNRSHQIGVLFADEARSGLTHDYFASVLDSFKRTAENYDYDITFINSNKKRSRSMSYLEHSRYRGFDGVVLACIDFSDEWVVELLQSDIPVVTIDYLYDNRCAVISDNLEGMRELTEYICRQGHKKIAYIHGSSSVVTAERLQSFLQTMEERGLTVPAHYLKEAPYRDCISTYKLTNDLLDLKDRPTCIIYPDDYSAVGGVRAIRDRGLRIPEDISVAGYDGILVGQLMNPKLTTIRQDTEQIGCEAARELIGLIEKTDCEAAEYKIIPVRLEKGETVAAL